MNACDVLIAGAGPAGMAAAVAASGHGCRVMVVDDNPSAGGQIWRGYAERNAEGQTHQPTFAELYRRWRKTIGEFRGGTRIVAQPAPGVVRLESESGCADVRYARLILATGARERFLPFPGWTLPGVMGAGGLQAMVKAGLPIAGKRVVLSGSGPLLLAVAANLKKQGAKIAGVFEQAPLQSLIAFSRTLRSHPGKLVEGARYGVATIAAPYRTSAWVVRAHGEASLRGVTVKVSEKLREIACDYLGCGFHLVPNLELPRLLGCRIDDGYVNVNAAQHSSVKAVYCAGELTGIGGLEKALVEGEIAGLAAAGRSATHLYRKRDRMLEFARRLDGAFGLRAELRALAEAETIVCRCEDARRGALEEMRNGREAKLHTRCGMGPCQGRVCGPATMFLFGWESESVRPPVVPVRTATLAAELEKIDA